MEIKMKTYIRAAVAALLFACVAVPAWAGAPTDYVKERTVVVGKILGEPESKARTEELGKALTDTVDFRELASRALGEHWVKRTAEEQQEFLDLLQRMLRANYQQKLQGKKLEKDYTLNYTDEKLRKEMAIVKAEVVFKDGKKPIHYKLLKRGESWVIFDIVIDDISLEETYSEDYTEIIVNEGWPALIQKMKDRVKELEAPAKKPAKKAAKKAKSK
jgi:phospholipid transport system substrate-binding protein